MPELPEVETVRQGLEPNILGREIARAESYSPKLRLPIPENFSEILSGRTIDVLSRRAKYILIGLGDLTALLHLGMSGQVLITWDETPRQKHDHFRLYIKDGPVITYRDPRRFGLITFCPTCDLESHRLLAAIGPEPLSNHFNGQALRESLQNKTVSIKAALLDQRVVAGVGNIYASEALYRAGINPKRKAGSLSLPRCERLASEVRNVLGDALKSGGSSLKDYVRVDGELGYFQHSFQVYDREGQPCQSSGCSGTINRFVQNQRSTFYCPKCQR